MEVLQATCKLEEKPFPPTTSLHGVDASVGSRARQGLRILMTYMFRLIFFLTRGNTQSPIRNQRIWAKPIQRLTSQRTFSTLESPRGQGRGYHMWIKELDRH